MKKFEQLGRSLSKEEMKKVMGGGDSFEVEGGKCGDTCSGPCTIEGGPCNGVEGKCSSTSAGKCYCYALC